MDERIVKQKRTRTERVAKSSAYSYCGGKKEKKKTCSGEDTKDMARQLLHKEVTPDANRPFQQKLGIKMG